MKITKYLYLIFIIGLYIINYFFLKIDVFPFTGIVLGLLIVFIIGINVYLKFKNKKKGLHSDDFIFSPEVAKTLKKVDLGIQYETSIIATFFLIVGLLSFVIYTIFFTPYEVIIKVFISFNSIFAMVLMGSMLVTNYQQFISYRDSIKMFGNFTNQFGTEVMSTDKLFGTESNPNFEQKKPGDKINESESEPKDIEILFPKDDNNEITDKEMLEKLFKNNMNNTKKEDNIERRGD